MRAKRILLLSVLAGFCVTVMPSVAQAQSSSCYDGILIGVHGINEGLASSDPTKGESLTIQDVTKDFMTTVYATHPKTNYYDYAYVSYPNDTHTNLAWWIWDFATISAHIKLFGEPALDAVFNDVTKGCPLTRVGLVGYSEGAWIIHQWLADHMEDWPWIYGTAYFGDPCYDNPPDEGLGRLFPGVATCGPGRPVYPGGDPNQKWLTQAWSYCASGSNLVNFGDPICGIGYKAGAGGLNNQLVQATQCGTESDADKQTKCPHFYYQLGNPPGYNAAVDAAAKFFAQQLG